MLQVMPSRPNRQEQRSRQAREQIVQAALTVFALKGYAEASMDDICLAAGTSKGGLYHHFRSKPAVLAAVVTRLGDAGVLAPPFVARDSLPPMGREALARVIVEVWAEAARDEPLRARLTASAAASDGAAISGAAWDLADLLAAGGIAELVTRTGEPAAETAARRLGIEEAA
jgi:AcrR family transcriptional regulator